MAKDFSLIIKEVFYFISALLVVFVILEIVWPNIILAYLNLNYLILAWLLSGLVSLIKR
ncbi:MAG: hypothetical protein WC523_02015 [Patescibacteria group bacterium]|jgi:hypothetical protein